MSTDQTALVSHVAQLAHIPLKEAEIAPLATAFSETLKHIENLQDLDVSGVNERFQVMDATNVTRQDIVDTSRTFSQQQALSQAEHTHDGYFVVGRLIDKDA